jgi:hypothetical protein
MPPGRLTTLIQSILARVPSIATLFQDELAREREQILERWQANTRSLSIGPRLSLHGLPTEVLVRVARYLPAASEASLVLTCRVILWKLGDLSWSEIAMDDYNPQHYQDWGRYSHRPERGRFLQLLDRDLPHLINCYYCKVLHTPEKTVPRKSKPAPIDRPCTAIERQLQKPANTQFKTIFNEITFSKVQHLVKLHLRFGRDATPLLRQLSKTVTFRQLRTFCAVQGEIIHEMTTLANIVSGSLVIRSEHIIVIPTSLIHLIKSPIFREFFGQKICPHSPEVINYDDFWLRSRDKKKDRKCRCDATSYRVPIFVRHGLQRCVFCKTEFQVDAARIPRGMAVSFVVWQDLGDCSSPHEAIWEGTITPKENWRNMTWDVGSIKASFEAVSSNVPEPWRVLPGLDSSY